MNNVTNLGHSWGDETVSQMFSTQISSFCIGLFGYGLGFFLVCSLWVSIGVVLTLDIKVSRDERQFLQYKITMKNLLISHHTLPFKAPINGRVVREYLNIACEDCPKCLYAEHFS